MARPKSLQPKLMKNIALTQETVTRMELELFSEAEGRVPVGAQSELIERLLQEHFRKINRALRKDKQMEAVFEAAQTDVEGG